MKNAFTYPLLTILNLPALVTLSLLLSLQISLYGQNTQPQAATQSGQKSSPEQIIKDALAGYLANPANHAVAAGYISAGAEGTVFLGKISPENPRPPQGKDLFELGDFSEVFVGNLSTALGFEGLIQPENALQDAMPDSIFIPKYRLVVCSLPQDDPADRKYTPYHQVMCYASFETPPGQITFCQLAAHSSGLPLWPTNLKPKKKGAFEAYTEKNLYSFLKKYQLRDTPGLHFSHSHTGMILLADALSLSTGQPYETLLMQYLTGPLKIDDTRLSLTSDMASRRIQGYDHKGKPAPLPAYRIMGPAFGLRSTPSDMMTWLRVNLNPATSSSELKDIIEASQQARTSIDQGPWAGSSSSYGWIISTDNIIWMKGQSGGFSCFMGFNKESGKGIFILSNSANPVEVQGFEILRKL